MDDDRANRPAVIVVHGQSNAANFGSVRHAARDAVDNFDPVTGKCFAAADPLLGSDGMGGSFSMIGSAPHVQICSSDLGTAVRSSGRLNANRLMRRPSGPKSSTDEVTGYDASAVIRHT